MAFQNLDFLNKNMYRKYPIRATSTYFFQNGQELPLSLISSIQVTTTYANRRVYISKVYAKSGYVSVLLREYATGIVLGSFQGVITQANQVLTLEPAIANVSGTITIGDPAAIDLLSGSGYFSPDNGLLEDSTVFVFTPPSVTSFIHNGDTATGHVVFTTLTGSNVLIASLDPDVTFTVIDRTLIQTKNDFSASIGTCGTPLIKQINTVFPDSTGNIDIYGILPVGIEIGTGIVGVGTPTLTLNDFCPERNKLSPPAGNTSDAYYADILTTLTPEWKTWPQFSD